MIGNDDQVFDDSFLKKYQLECLHGKKAGCECACPLDIRIKEIIKNIGKGKFDSAWHIYEKDTLFPNIVSKVCTANCQTSCTLNDKNSPVQMRLLEDAVCKFHAAKLSTKYYINPKQKKVLVVGGGFTGLSCAGKLAQRGYQVTLAEKSETLAGRLIELGVMSEAEVVRELERVTSNLQYLEICKNNMVESLNGLPYDAFFIAIGENGSKLTENDDQSGIFVCDHHGMPEDIICSIQNGFAYSYAIEEYLKTGNIREPDIINQSRYLPNTKEVKVDVLEKNAVFSTKQEAQAEAERCEMCDCTKCIDACEMLSYFKKDPKSIAVDMGSLLHNTALTRRVGVRMISACTQCGACEKVCPKELSIREMFVKCKQFLNQEESLPPVFSEFWLDDMQFSTNEEASFKFTLTGEKSCEYLFFPGCQLGASDPEYVIKTYEFLGTLLKNVGIYQTCCGMPALWSGRNDLLYSEIDKIRQVWKDLNCPTIILTCPSCKENFRQYLKEIPTIFIWELKFNAKEIGTKKQIEVFDPCVTRNMPDTKNNIRELLCNMDFQVKEDKNEQIRCCGYGGLIKVANPNLYETIVEKNIKKSDLPYVTYCINCRDTFTDYGKLTYHILDLLVFGDLNRMNREVPSLSNKRMNRRILKNEMLKKYKEIPFSINEKDVSEFIFIESVKRKMSAMMLLEEIIVETVLCSEKENNFLIDSESGMHICHKQFGAITSWVYYEKNASSYIIQNVYTHRIQIMDELNHGK